MKIDDCLRWLSLQVSSFFYDPLKTLWSYYNALKGQPFLSKRFALVVVQSVVTVGVLGLFVRAKLASLGELFLFAGTSQLIEALLLLSWGLRTFHRKMVGRGLSAKLVSHGETEKRKEAINQSSNGKTY